jgi:ubiquinone/menaquinone biosynthesis C-methylase UbiE
VIDLGCGTGAFTVKMHEKCPESRFLATDISDGMLRAVNERELPNVTIKNVDATTLAGIEDSTFSHGVCSFAMSFVPNPRCK